MQRNTNTDGTQREVIISTGNKVMIGTSVQHGNTPINTQENQQRIQINNTVKMSNDCTEYEKSILCDAYYNDGNKTVMNLVNSIVQRHFSLAKVMVIKFMNCHRLDPK